MVLNKAKHNMYSWCDFTFNPLGGKCSHNCHYCYMFSQKSGLVKRFHLKKYEGRQRLIEKELEVNLHDLTVCRREELPFVSKDEVIIFLCSGNDLLTKTTSKEAIVSILDKCNEAPENWYLIQSKNPIRILEFKNKLPPKTILGTTLETNIDEVVRQVSNAPLPSKRFLDFVKVKEKVYSRRMLSVEPKMKCQPEIFSTWTEKIEPDFVSIGADSGNNNLIEPNREELERLIGLLEQFTTVYTKENLGRLL